MKVPKYVQSLMTRTELDITVHADGLYDIKIYKSTEYAHVETLRDEIEHLQGWMDKNGLCFRIDHLPETTRYKKQYALCAMDKACVKAMLPYIQKASVHQQQPPKKSVFNCINYLKENY